MSDQRSALNQLIEEAREEDLPSLRELLSRFQAPLDFPLQPPATRSLQSDAQQARQELILGAHMRARWAHLERQHTARIAKRLRIDPERIEYSAGGGSTGENGAVDMTRYWSEESTVCHLNTFSVDNHEIITFDRAGVSESGAELNYKVRVLTPDAESEADFNVPF